jgi:hypothetical protein
MIQTDKRIDDALYALLLAAGVQVWIEDGVLMSTDDAVAQQVIDAYDPIPEAKAAKSNSIQAERERIKADGYVVQGNRFHSDRDSRIQQLGLVIMGANIPPGLMWKAMGGVFVEMTPALALAIFQTTAANDAALHAYGEQRRAELVSLQTLAEVEAFDVTAGWPAV